MTYKRLTDEEANTLYSYLKSSITPMDTLIQIMFETGARMGEVFLLGGEHLMGNCLTIEPLKGSRKRVVTISNSLKIKLLSLISTHENLPEYSNTFRFAHSISIRDKITLNSLHKKIARYLNNYGLVLNSKKYGSKLSIKLTPHVLRHTAFSRLYEATKDLMLVKEWAGHHSINSTIKYMQLSNRDEANRLNMSIING